MKYYILNKKECLNSIWTNPEIVKTKSFAKIEKYKRLQKQIAKLETDIFKEIKASNSRMITDEMISKLIAGDGEEITNTDYSALYNMPLYDRQEQRINCYVRSETLKGKLYGEQIILDKKST